MKFPSSYEPSQYESKIYELWEKSGVFTPKKGSAQDSFSIMMPLPNANARLHLGSALFVAFQDITARYQRLKGKQVLWLPGADHAGFETWVVYEKKLAAEGKSRFDYSREELYQQVWDFVAGNRKQFERQFRELGASVDWSRFTFSLDDKIVNQVYKTFKKMWDDGLVYRGERIVNYCTYHGTSFADIEVEHKEEDSQLWYINYPLTDGSGQITVATSRPETMLGDTGVAVNPRDRRYADLIGKTVHLPLSGREVPIVADEFVDPDFGTGAVKLTPAHDPNDFEAAKRLSLPMINIIDHQGKITDQAPAAYRGLDVKTAREKVAADLQTQGFLQKVEAYRHSVGHCYKCNTVIEPLLRDQWFVNMQPLAAQAITALQARKIDFYPGAKKDQLIGYLEGLRDWNISRQIAWGIPIPAFQNVDNPDDWIFDDRVGEEILQRDGKTYRRDQDVFDTWFSSGQWPFATLGLGSEDFKQFYPTSLMETGGEILYPWVSRMIMLGLYMTGEIPFKDVYIHGYVLASDGSKMSKSLGNMIDPDDYRAKYGADALRLGLIDDRAAAVNRPFDETKAVAGRNFCNKLWNIARFYNTLELKDQGAKSPADIWILNKLSILQKSYVSQLDNYSFSEAYSSIYQFVWNDLADWYVESAKTKGAANGAVFGRVLKACLVLSHPFAPFVTEAIWQELGWDKDGLLIQVKLPDINEPIEPAKVTEFNKIINLVTEIRRVKAAAKLLKPEIQYLDEAIIEDNAALISNLASLSGLHKVTGQGTGIKLVMSGANVWLVTDEATVSQYRVELSKRGSDIKTAVERLKTRLDNKNYLSSAPEEIVAQTRDELMAQQQLLEQVNKEMAALES